MDDLTAQILAENHDLQRLLPADGPVLLVLGYKWIRAMLAELLSENPENPLLFMAYQMIAESTQLDHLVIAWNHRQENSRYSEHFIHLQSVMNEAISLL